MREMEEGSRRVGSSGGVIKNRNSSGCLIIKKKADRSGAGGTDCPPAPGPVADKVYTSRKKRARVVTSEESSDEDDRMSEPYNGKGLPARGNRVTSSGSSLAYKAGTSRESDFIREKDLLFRSKKTLDIYDFDEYDDLDDVGRSGTGHSDWLEAQGSGRMLSGRKPGMTRGARREFEAAPSSRLGIMDDTKSFFSGSSSCKKFNRRLDAKSKIPVPVSAVKQKFDNSTSREAIRLQGKNGVLKLMVKNKTVGGSSTTPDYDAGEPSIVPGSRQLNSKNMQSRPSVYPERKVQSNSRNFDQIQSEKHGSRKPESSESSEENSDGSAESDVPPKRPAKDVETHRPIKRERRVDIGNSSPQTPPPSKLKEGKAKRGSGTEKQLLREKIRNMLVSAGWTIDYRPRRNRDYFDAVYINPSGTAYWSIIKAYDAFQKQLEEGALGECTPFNQISDEILSKLTRQTQKKLEKELKRKKREDIISKRKKKAGPGKFVNDEHEADSADTGSEEDKLSTFIKQNGRSLKGRSQESHDGQGSSLSGKMLERNHRPFSASKSHFDHGRKTKTIGRCTLLVRNAEKGLNSEGDGFVPYKGKRTILSWLIDSGVVELSEKVLYMNRKRSRVLLEGWITRDGVHCGCCSKILTVSKFEIHAASKLRQPFQNIYLCSGNSLLQCQTDAWNSQDESLCRGFNTVNVDGDDPNDDTCGICGDGGDLICCDGCPSTYHQSCLGVEMLPPGDWHCPHCSCKFCGLADEISDVIKICSLCERKYHGSCIQEMDSAIDSSSNPTSLCGRKCQELFEQLQQLLGVKHELESGLSWSLIHRTDLETDPSSRGFSQRVEWNSKLAVALSVMDECFLPVIDRRSGVNLMHSVLYNCGSNFSRLNYSGFYTAILEKGDEIISAASIRIHGRQLAEMPFIGTRNIYRRQGMCRRLFFAIESALRALKVEKMMIPAISELMHTWTTVFGFRVLNETHKQEMKSLNMLVFPGVDMLQKKLLDVETSKTDAIMGTGTKITNNGSVSSPSETNVVETLQETDRRPANDSQESISSDRISFPIASLYAIDEVGPEALIRRDQETKISSMESNEELVDSAPDLKIGSLAGSQSDSLKAAQPPIGFPVDNDKPISAVCENTDANIIRILPVDSGLGSVFVSSAGASVEKSSPGHIDKDELYPSADLKTSASVSGEELESTSRLKEASPSDARRNTLVQNSVLDEFQAGNEIEPMAANGEVHSAAGIKSRLLVSDVDASLVVNTGSDDAVSETNGSVVGNTNSVFEAPFASTLVLDSGSDNVDVAENA